jgi:N-acetylmuramoyl-L-alanine amidase
VVTVLALVGVFLGERIATGLGLFKAPGTPPLASAVSTRAAGMVGGSVGQVEVPDLSGMGLVSAKVVLEAAGLIAEVHVDTTLTPSAEQHVHAQSPTGGSVVAVGASVVLNVPRAAAIRANHASKAHLKRKFVVVLDPGHQAKADSTPEPVGPGASVTCQRATVGGMGVATHVAEYELARQIAAGLEDRLVAEGVKVVLTRTTNDVDVSEAQRAAKANDAKADLFVQIRMRSGVESEAVGVATLYPAANRWTKAKAPDSRKAAEAIQQNVVATTDAANRGAAGVDGVTAFNWCKSPCVLVEAGCLSNAMEDRLLASARYQDLVVEGMADGIIEYLAGGH